MRKGPGRVQRAILALITAEPDGAWTFEELCDRVYLDSPIPTRAQLGAVGRAIKSMSLPGTWTTGSVDGDRRRCLYDECSLASVRKTHVFWVNDYPFEPGGSVFKKVEEAKVWRDASPMERIEMQLRNAQMIRQMSSRPAAIDSCNEHIRELEKEKAELLAQAT